MDFVIEGILTEETLSKGGGSYIKLISIYNILILQLI